MAMTAMTAQALITAEVARHDTKPSIETRLLLITISSASCRARQRATGLPASEPHRIATLRYPSTTLH
ncbi:MAG TPA: hypothetical protein VGD37_12140 [Kofleriaceae bacterium]|jgi:hypothetical protein